LLKSYLDPLGFEIETWPAHEDNFDSQASGFVGAPNSQGAKAVAAVVLQSPNRWGRVEDFTQARSLAQKLQTKSVAVVTHAHTLVQYQSPGEAGIDIVCGEAQSFGVPVGFGGPHLGLIACRKADVRQMPGRLVGETVDAKGQRAFCVTLATREQHIRREKATSNICSNQNLMALRACIYLTLMGPAGLKEVARQSRAKTYYARDQLKALFKKTASDLKVADGELFNELSIVIPAKMSLWTAQLLTLGEERGQLLGYPSHGPQSSKRCQTLTMAFTEKHSKDQIDQLVTLVGSTL
jgi:glycine dehydrogenase subunit 1